MIQYLQCPIYLQSAPPLPQHCIQIDSALPACLIEYNTCVCIICFSLKKSSFLNRFVAQKSKNVSHKNCFVRDRHNYSTIGIAY